MDISKIKLGDVSYNIKDPKLGPNVLIGSAIGAAKQPVVGLANAEMAQCYIANSVGNSCRISNHGDRTDFEADMLPEGYDEVGAHILLSEQANTYIKLHSTSPNGLYISNGTGVGTISLTDNKAYITGKSMVLCDGSTGILYVNPSADGIQMSKQTPDDPRRPISGNLYLSYSSFAGSTSYDGGLGNFNVTPTGINCKRIMTSPSRTYTTMINSTTSQVYVGDIEIDGSVHIGTNVDIQGEVAIQGEGVVKLGTRVTIGARNQSDVYVCNTPSSEVNILGDKIPGAPNSLTGSILDINAAIESNVQKGHIRLSNTGFTGFLVPPSVPLISINSLNPAGVVITNDPNEIIRNVPGLNQVYIAPNSLTLKNVNNDIAQFNTTGISISDRKGSTSINTNGINITNKSGGGRNISIGTNVNIANNVRISTGINITKETVISEFGINIDNNSIVIDPGVTIGSSGIKVNINESYPHHGLVINNIYNNSGVSISKGVHIGTTFIKIGSDVEIGSTTVKIGSTGIQIGTDPESTINIGTKGINIGSNISIGTTTGIQIGTDPESTINIGTEGINIGSVLTISPESGIQIGSNAIRIGTNVSVGGTTIIDGHVRIGTGGIVLGSDYGNIVVNPGISLTIGSDEKLHIAWICNGVTKEAILG